MFGDEQAHGQLMTIMYAAQISTDEGVHAKQLLWLLQGLLEKRCCHNRAAPAECQPRASKLNLFTSHSYAWMLSFFKQAVKSMLFSFPSARPTCPAEPKTPCHLRDQECVHLNHAQLLEHPPAACSAQRPSISPAKPMIAIAPCADLLT